MLGIVGGAVVSVNYSFVHQTSHDPLLSSTTSSFRQVYNGGYDNQAYSSQLSQSSETTITICTPTPGAGLSTLHESHDSSSSPPDYYQLYNGHKPPSSSDVTMAVSSSSEEKEQLSTSPEIEKQPLPLSAEAAEQNGTPPQLHQSNGDSNTLEHAHAEAENQPHPPAAEKNPDQSVDDQQPHPLVTEKNPHPPADEKQPHPSPAEKNSHPSTDVKQPHPSTETLEHNGSPPQTESSNINSTRETPATHTATNAVTNGTAAGADNLTATNTVDEKTREKIYPKTKKKGIMKGLFSKEKPRRGSEKPLLYSQSSVTTPTPVDSPPQGKIFNRAESDIFYEEDEHQHEEDTKITMNANGMFITPIEETSL